LGEQPFFDRLGALLKNPCSRYVVGNRFLWLCRGQEHRQKWKDEVPASGHDKELFFRKSAETNALSSFPPMCEFVEGIVTVAHFVTAAALTLTRRCEQKPEKKQQGNITAARSSKPCLPAGLVTA